MQRPTNRVQGKSMCVRWSAAAVGIRTPFSLPHSLTNVWSAPKRLSHCTCVDGTWKLTSARSSALWILSCRSAEMIEKELWVHLLAYNLTRLLMSEAAALCDRKPRSIRFRHTVQLWSSWSQCGQQLDAEGWVFLLQAVAGHRVGNRPGRREPRAIKRRSKPRKLLDMPRSHARNCCYRFEQ